MPSVSKLLVPTRPNVLVKPDGIISTGLAEDTIDLAGLAGLDLDGWQQHDLTVMMAERAGGRWAASEFAEIVARQNGKGSILEARELGGLFLLREKLIIHSAHLAVTSADAFNRLLGLIENTPELERQLKRVSRSTQDMSIETKHGAKVLFKTRTKGGGRGLTGDCIVLDEAMYLYWAQMSALMFTLSARPNPQIIYASSAGEAESEVLHKVRRRAMAGTDPTLGYCEYSAEPGDDPSDPQTWAKSNPALGIRVLLESVQKEHDTLPAGEFGRERLTIFDPDSSEEAAWSVVSSETWAARTDEGSTIVSQVALAIEVDRERSRAVIASAGRNATGAYHVEIVPAVREIPGLKLDGVDWVVARVKELVASHDVASVAIDAVGPAGFLIDELKEAGVEVHSVTAREAAQACGLFVTSAKAGGLNHLDQPDLNEDVKTAAKRDSGEVWYWKRTGEDESIQLIASTLALGRVPSLAEPEETFDPMAEIH